MLWMLGAFGLLLVALPVAGVLWMTAVPGRSHAGALPPLTPEQIELAARLQDTRAGHREPAPQPRTPRGA